MGIPDSWNEYAPLVMVTKLCIGPDRKRVRFILRDEPNNPTDSGWIFFSGNEPEGYTDDSSNFTICPLFKFVELEPELESLLVSPVGSVYEKIGDDAPWVKVDDYEY